jgi:hypothetical protein
VNTTLEQEKLLEVYPLYAAICIGLHIKKKIIASKFLNSSKTNKVWIKLSLKNYHQRFNLSNYNYNYLL